MYHTLYLFIFAQLSKNNCFSRSLTYEKQPRQKAATGFVRIYNRGDNLASRSTSAVPNEPKLELNSMSCLVIKARLSKSKLELKQIHNTCQVRIFGQSDLYKSYKPLVYLLDIDLC